MTPLFVRWKTRRRLLIVVVPYIRGSYEHNTSMNTENTRKCCFVLRLSPRRPCSWAAGSKDRAADEWKSCVWGWVVTCDRRLHVLLQNAASPPPVRNGSPTPAVTVAEIIVRHLCLDLRCVFVSGLVAVGGLRGWTRHKPHRQQFWRLKRIYRFN